MKTVYQCDNCKRDHDLKKWIFHCIECGKEICEDCMFGWATCKECAKGKTREFLEKRFDDFYLI
jgi:hypothetical protein